MLFYLLYCMHTLFEFERQYLNLEFYAKTQLLDLNYLTVITIPTNLQIISIDRRSFCESSSTAEVVKRD